MTPGVQLIQGQVGSFRRRMQVFQSRPDFTPHSGFTGGTDVRKNWLNTFEREREREGGREGGRLAPERAEEKPFIRTSDEDSGIQQSPPADIQEQKGQTGCKKF